MTRTFRVWAPFAHEVSLLIDGSAEPMQPGADGYFYAQPPAAGTRYSISINGGPPRPDPRSRWQPQGVHGASCMLQDDYAWTDAGFRAAPLSSALIYELHVGTFTPEGTYAAAGTRLEHLLSLGVTHVELMPLATFPGRRGWGYDGVCAFAPHPAYGAPDELKAFVDACHARGLGVLLDVVYNHLGPDGNYLPELGPYFTDRYHTPWGAAVNVDGPGSDQVRRFFIDNALMWLRDYHMDGLRLDAVHALHDRSALPFLEQLVVEVRELEAVLGRTFSVIAESDQNDPRLTRPREAYGFGLDAQWSDDFHHALHAALTGERNGYYAGYGALSDIAHALQHVFVYDGRYNAFRGHTLGRSAGDASSARFLGYLQTHDQVGNRAGGERIGQLTSDARVRIGAALVFIAPFVPMIFQGEEWNASTPFLYFTDHSSRELAQAVREGRQRELSAFGWRATDILDPQNEQTFLRSVLRWDEREAPPHADMLRWYQALSRLRHAHPELASGRREHLWVQCDDLQQTLTVRRGAITLQANLGPHAARLPTPPGAPVLFHPARPTLTGSHVTLPPDGCCVWELGGA